MDFKETGWLMWMDQLLMKEGNSGGGKWWYRIVVKGLGAGGKGYFRIVVKGVGGGLNGITELWSKG